MTVAEVDPVTATTPTGATCNREHEVQFYETDQFLGSTVASFVAPALRERNSAIIVATPAHRDQFAAAIRAAGIDLDAAVDQGRYVALDAAELLLALMVDGAPDRARFRAALEPVLDRAAMNGREVKIYGEMVALLWDEGDVTSAIALEDLWNDLADSRRFSLLCAYPLHAFDDSAIAAFEQVCVRHTTVVPAEGWSQAGDVDEQRRIVAGLQLTAVALEADLRRLRQEQGELAELAYMDSLTGLPNRRSFDLHLEREWGLAIRDQIDSFVVIADLDDFKGLNDRYGHAAGDEALRWFADALRRTARSTDIPARIGGDEFAVLLIRCDDRAAHTFAARLRDALTSGRGWLLNVSLGHASALESASPSSALKRADLEMLATKRSSRGQTRTDPSRRYRAE